MLIGEEDGTPITFFPIMDHPGTATPRHYFDLPLHCHPSRPKPTMSPHRTPLLALAFVPWPPMLSSNLEEAKASPLAATHTHTCRSMYTPKNIALPSLGCSGTLVCPHYAPHSHHARGHPWCHHVLPTPCHGVDFTVAYDPH